MVVEVICSGTVVEVISLVVEATCIRKEAVVATCKYNLVVVVVVMHKNDHHRHGRRHHDHQPQHELLTNILQT